VQIYFSCPHCGRKIEVDARASETKLVCPECDSLITVPQTLLGPGITLGGFRIIELIGQGGMGVVYRARQLSMDRDIALKILPSHLTANEAIRARFLNEVRMAARLDHANIVTAYEAGRDGDLYYLAMAYVKGELLSKQLDKHGAMPTENALRIARDIADALCYAWDEHKLLHRDVKPGNIIIDQYNKPRLMDMGLSKSLDSAGAITVRRTVMGSPNYMSPEQASGAKDINFRTDMYALGCTLYHMLTGRKPFDGYSMTRVLRLQTTSSMIDPRDINANIPTSCVELMSIMLSKHPDQRHANWSELITDIDRVLSGKRPASHTRSLVNFLPSAPLGSALYLKNRFSRHLASTRFSAPVLARIAIALVLFAIILHALLQLNRHTPTAKIRRVSSAPASMATNIPASSDESN